MSFSAPICEGVNHFDEFVINDQDIQEEKVEGYQETLALKRAQEAEALLVQWASDLGPELSTFEKELFQKVTG